MPTPRMMNGLPTDGPVKGSQHATLSEMNLRLEAGVLLSTIDQASRQMRGRPRWTVALPFSRGFSIDLRLIGVHYSCWSCVCIVALDATAA
jgi:hypothetical protein